MIYSVLKRVNCCFVVAAFPFRTKPLKVKVALPSLVFKQTSMMGALNNPTTYIQVWFPIILGYVHTDADGTEINLF